MAVDFYETLHDFIDGKDMTKEDVYSCLRNVLGHEVCELLKNPQQPISLSDVRTDLKYLFEKIVQGSIPRG